MTIEIELWKLIAAIAYVVLGYAMYERDDRRSFLAILLWLPICAVALTAHYGKRAWKQAENTYYCWLIAGEGPSSKYWADAFRLHPKRMRLFSGKQTAK